MAATKDLLALVKTLGREFVRRGMDSHARALRIYYLAIRHGLARSEGNVEVNWSHRHTEEWLKMLRIPPFQNAYPLFGRGNGCPRCHRKRGHQVSVRTECVFPGGAKMRCEDCSLEWLTEDD
jgi:hypothetical protein